MPSLKRDYIDFKFGFSSANATAGQVVRTGNSQYYGWEAENRSSSAAYQLANDEVMDIEGVEIIPARRNAANSKGLAFPIKYVRFIIDGAENDNINFNEYMAPARVSGAPLAGPSDFWDGGHCINIGKSMLSGTGPHNTGAPWEGALKVGMGQTLEVEVGFPRTSEGGESTIDTDLIVRVHRIKVKGEQKLLDVLKTNGHLNANGSVDQSFSIGDSEIADQYPFVNYEGSFPGNRPFKMADWTQLHGGRNRALPSAETVITYAKNAAATTTNDWFQFDQQGVKVNDAFQVLKWTLEKNEVYKWTHCAILDHHNLKYFRIYRQGRAPEQVYRVDPGRNGFPCPASRYPAAIQLGGPVAFDRPVWMMGEVGSFEVKDNGTSIRAWNNDSTDVSEGLMVALWGKKFTLEL